MCESGATFNVNKRELLIRQMKYTKLVAILNKIGGHLESLYAIDTDLAATSRIALKKYLIFLKSFLRPTSQIIIP